MEILRPAIQAMVADAIEAGVVGGAMDVLELAPLPNVPSAPPTPLLLAPPPPGEPPPVAIGDAEPGPENVFYPVVDEAAEQLAKAEILTPEQYYALKAGARDEAFTISGNLTGETVNQVRDILAESMAKGETFDTFAGKIDEAFETMPLSQPRLELVFRQTMHTAMSDGTEVALQSPMVVDAFPYRAYFSTSDQRRRKEHKALETLGLNGTNIYRADDPVWKLFRPPWAWGCRCSFAPYTVRQAARNGVKEAQDWLDRADNLADERETSQAEQMSAAAPPIPEFVKIPAFAFDPKVLDPRFKRT